MEALVPKFNITLSITDENSYYLNIQLKGNMRYLHWIQWSKKHWHLNYIIILSIDEKAKAHKLVSLLW